jgi:hypothetical protein
MSRRIPPPWSDDMEKALISHSKTVRGKAPHRGLRVNGKIAMMAAAVFLVCLAVIGIRLAFN